MWRAPVGPTDSLKGEWALFRRRIKKSFYGEGLTCEYLWGNVTGRFRKVTKQRQQDLFNMHNWSLRHSSFACFVFHAFI